jgi:hypothetical protein
MQQLDVPHIKDSHRNRIEFEMLIIPILFAVGWAFSQSTAATAPTSQATAPVSGPVPAPAVMLPAPMVAIKAPAVVVKKEALAAVVPAEKDKKNRVPTRTWCSRRTLTMRRKS